MIAVHEKSWEEGISKLNPDDKDYEKSLKIFREAKEKSKKEIEKMSGGFLEEIQTEKNRASFYR